MEQKPQPPQDGVDFVKGTKLYRTFLAEREEIMRHKWLESEKRGEDIGYECALLDWIVRHRSAWRKSARLAEAT